MRYSQIMKRMGFRKDQEGIMNRYMREKIHWDRHLENTRNFINRSFRDANPKSVAVLGSGWLLDIPVNEMSKRFEKIYLVDVLHPHQIRKRVGHIDNVELVEADLTGGAVEQLWQYTRDKTPLSEERFTHDVMFFNPLANLEYDVIISANLLNQLDIIVCDFLMKKGYFQQQAPDHLRSRIQAFHIEWIKQTPGCLITDTLEINLHDNTGEKSVKSLLYAELPEGFRTEQWIWEFDTHGTYNEGSTTSMQVQAIEWH